ncbi:MAG TPA: ABC transporter permease/substrate-binding protein [Steroidobacteraceae bacterium]
MDERVRAAAHLLPDYLSQHILLSAAALLLGLLIGLPLVIAASRSRRLRWPVLTFASVIQTIPSLALLALFYPVLLALSSLSRKMLGHGFSALGFLPSLLALTLYSMLPILRNGVAALTGIEPAIIEAARGVGMTQRQRLLRVELPLAAPVLMAGIRTSAVWVIGTATLSTPVGQTSLGNYIFSGLQIEDWVSVLFGCVAAVLLAITTDQLLALIESGVSRRRPAYVWIGCVALCAGVAAAGAVPLASGHHTSYVVGAKNFSEQYILADLMATRLRSTGATVTTRSGLGSVIAFRALAANELDVYVDYSGTVWANILRREDSPPRAQMLTELGSQLRSRYGVELLGALGFENAYALAMRRDQAAALGIRTLADLATHAAQLRIGGDFEFFQRPEWRALRDRYGLRFEEQRTFQPTFLYRAVTSGDVDVISAFSSDGRVAAYDLTVLEDPQQVIPPYDAIMLVSPHRAADPLLRNALAPLAGAIPIAAMRAANYQVDRADRPSTPQAAADWLGAKLSPSRPGMDRRGKEP